MANELSKKAQSIFEQIKRLDKNNNEYWSGRELAKVLEYSEYRHFKPVIEKAKEACKIADNLSGTISRITSRWFQLVQGHSAKWRA